ncbi:hypothetical protein AK812_SmicGene3985 [Symbiodinium microadriaticum]|uniref:Uncharacterized protein n=1 Tax=Symbiodinium microadriaticum TaxID=2951 RepID=A0A1Q9EXH9_SYMMI|nr:hypothetical protein AK812_SmicGene3985 [Symbiodinium microadriaticum]
MGKVSAQESFMSKLAEHVDAVDRRQEPRDNVRFLPSWFGYSHGAIAFDGIALKTRESRLNPLCLKIGQSLPGTTSRGLAMYRGRTTGRDCCRGQIESRRYSHAHHSLQ